MGSSGRNAVASHLALALLHDVKAETWPLSRMATCTRRIVGSETARIAAAMTTFDPDLTWARVAMTND